MPKYVLKMRLRLLNQLGVPMLSTAMPKYLYKSGPKCFKKDVSIITVLHMRHGVVKITFTRSRSRLSQD